MGEQHYRRSLGMPYDEEAYLMEAANGLAGPSTADQQEAFLKDGSDLYIEKVEGSTNDQRLADIEYELTYETNPYQRSILLAEKVVRTEQRHLDELAERHPRYSTALRNWLFEELQNRLDAGDPIDDEMFVEAQILAEFITEAHADKEDPELIAIAESMEMVIKLQRELNHRQGQLELAA